MQRIQVKTPVRVWMWVGMVMIFFQIILGGITRLTGSGLSITKWDIVTGALPPLNKEAWNIQFDLYKATPQYQKINQGMSLSQFKKIFFWEYIHRLWARSMGFVFIIPFAFFWFKNWLDKSLKKDLFIVFLLAGLVGLFGWIMVASGLVNRPWVNAYKLSVHLGLALVTLGYLLYTILKNSNFSLFPANIRKLPAYLFFVICIQIFLGGMMSGMKAALVYPTFPLMNGSLIDPIIFDLQYWKIKSFIDYDKSSFLPALVQILHRLTAFIVLGLFVYMGRNHWSNNWVKGFGFFLLVQIVLGITTLVLSIGQIPVLLGVLHQGVGIICLLLSLKWYLDSRLKISS